MFGVGWLTPLSWLCLVQGQLQWLWLLLAILPLAVASVRLRAGWPSS
jgi:hypothetical protein